MEKHIFIRKSSGINDQWVYKYPNLAFPIDKLIIHYRNTACTAKLDSTVLCPFSLIQKHTSWETVVWSKWTVTCLQRQEKNQSAHYKFSPPVLKSFPPLSLAFLLVEKTEIPAIKLQYFTGTECSPSFLHKPPALVSAFLPAGFHLHQFKFSDF